MKRLITYMTMVMLLAGASCIKEHPINPVGADEKSVQLKVAVPNAAQQRAVTRSIGASQENIIETLDVLAFRVESGVETFQYWTDAKKSAGSQDGAELQSFTATLRVRDYQQRFVLVTNAHQKVMDLISKVDWRN